MLSKLFRRLGWSKARAVLASLALLISISSITSPVHAADPNQGAGGPILVVTNGTTNFGRFYAEILRTEGLNSFAVVDVATVNGTLLSSYDVVILAKTALTSGQVTTFTNWVNAGGNLIAMDPDAQLYSLGGVAAASSTLSNGYLRVDTANPIGRGIVGETMQFHGAATRVNLSGATALATLYSTASTATTNPALTLRSVGSNGGQVALFAFDLATSVVLTRQGNPAWVGQERDGVSPIRSDDMFYGDAASDPQPNWIDLTKVTIPQADEQQRLLANLITSMNLDRKPLPRFWYLPHGHRAAVVMTGDDHGYAGSIGAQGQFDRLAAASAAGCSVNDWECLRGSIYAFHGTAITLAEANAYNAAGFELGVHVTSVCNNYDAADLEEMLDTQLEAFSVRFPGLPAPTTNRFHCIAWSGWATSALGELTHGIRLDTNYYYWPPGFVNNTPGHFTGSAMPMRFADLNGSLIDVYQAVTQMTDESGQDYPFTIDTYIDKALGPEQFFGVFTANVHTDYATAPIIDHVIASAVESGVPIIASRQLLTWLDGKNASNFNGITWSNNTLGFSISAGAGATGLTALVPRASANARQISTITRGGVDVPYEVVTIKGVEYAQIPALAGNYVTTYLPDTTAPTIVSRTPAPGATGVAAATTISIRFSESMDAASIGSSTIELRTAGNTLIAAAVSYDSSNSTARLTPASPLDIESSYSVTVRGGTADPRVKDAAGNALAASSTWSFSTVSANCPCTIWPSSATPAEQSSSDNGAVNLGVKFRSDVSGYVTGFRFYKGALNTGIHTGYLWSATGQLLTSATFTNESASGWQQVNLGSPYPIVANTTYVVSYHAPNGGYAANGGYFSSSGVDNGVLHAPDSVTGGGNGVFAYGAAGLFPNETWNGGNYWVDVVVSTTGSTVDTVPPSVAITAPTTAATYATSTGSLVLSGSASDNLGVTEVTWISDRGGSGVASGTSAWTVSAIGLQTGVNALTVTARDAAGNLATDVLTVTFTPPPVDTTPPSVTTQSPPAGAIGVIANASVTVTFSESLDAATVNSSTIELRAAGVLVPAAISYSGNVATLTPNANLASTTEYTVTVRGGATDPRIKDVAGNALAANASWTFTTGGEVGSLISLWPGTVTPVVASETDTTAVELGVKFRSDVNGYVTGLRFYKGPGNTGTHRGTLWSSTGQVLASATFINETASGWQQVSFVAPVPVVAGTTYVASYFAPNGGYSYDPNYFAVNGADNGVLHAPSNASANGNGVFLYGATGGFPTNSYAASNYWVDILFAAQLGPDTAAPTVVSTSPASGATGVSINPQITVTFNEAIDAATVNASSIELRGPGNTLIQASVSLNGAAATLSPISSLDGSTAYTVTVRGGASDPRVKDMAGNALAANVSWSFTTGAPVGPAITIWPNTVTPTVLSESGTSPVELGVKFQSDVAGYIRGIRFYKGPGNTGVHRGTLWNSSGQVLSSATFVNESATGWQEAEFSAPVPIEANTVYVASYFAPNGGYSFDTGYFTSSGADNGVLHAPATGVVNGNGVFIYGSSGGFPTSTYSAANYWVDVLFATSVGPDVTPPMVLATGPANGAVNIATNSPVTVTFNEPMSAATIGASTIELRTQGGTLVPASVSYSGTVATLVPSAPLADSSIYAVTVRGGTTDPRVKDVAGNALAANFTFSFTTAAAGGPCSANAITAENCLVGNPASEWDISGVGDTTIQGFATQISVNRGQTVSFKVDTTASNYRFDIYRMGYYGGLGARRITSVNPSATLPQVQPSCLTQAASGLIDCGNWGVSGSWVVPATAVSGIYFAKVIRTDTGGASHIFFIVRNDASTSDMVFQTSDTTWQAYNTWGGNSLYVGGPGTNPGRAYKVSYNRPFNTRIVDGGQDWVFNAEYPMVRWLERNGYDVSYISGIDTDRSGALLLNHRAFLSVGHDEYWSGQQRANVEAARAAGVNLAFFSGNEVFWKIRWEASIDGSGSAYRTLVNYKETHAAAKIDPSAEWTGTWRDPRFSPPSDGGRPENALTGTMFTVNSGTSAIVIPAAEGKMRFWRNTSIAGLTAGQTATLPQGTLGYEWDSDVDNGFRPAGLIRMSDTTVSGVDLLQDHGSSYATGTANHALTLYKHSSGARVFGAGTIQWTWGLDATHDRAGTPIDVRMQQATVNLFADMNVQPATLQSGLVTASASNDTVGPSVTIIAPAAGSLLPLSSNTVVSGTAADVGGVVGGVEVSVDGGTTWRRATGRETWTFNFAPVTGGATTIRVRAVDDSGNIGTPATVAVTVNSTVTCPCTIWTAAQAPTSAPDLDPGISLELGTRFRASANGFITAIRFYKNAGNTGTHVGTLWSATGAQLARVTFAGESALGWQQAPLSSPVPVTANSWYVVSYHTSSGSYIGEDGYFAANGVTNGPLYAARDGEDGSNGLYAISTNPTFPTQTYASENYWVDVVFSTTTGPDTTAPAVTITSPTNATTYATSSATLNLGGTASDNVGVALVSWTNDRGGSGTATGTTAWSASIPLQSGANVITVTARDAANNPSTDTLTVTYTPDTTAPVATITSPTNQATYVATGNTVNLTGSATDAVGVTQVTWSNDRGGSGTASGTATWSVSGIALQAGANVLTIRARDAAGNEGADVLTVTYAGDITAPVVTITSPTNSAAYSVSATTATVNIGGTATDAVGVTQVTWANSRGGAGTATGTTSWSVTGIALLSGANVITVTARDAAGNANTDVLTVNRAADTTAPTISITSPTSSTSYATVLGTISLGGSAADAVGVTQVTWSSNRGGSGSASGTTSWTVAGITLLSGSNILTVTARDAAGNQTNDTLTVTYTPDTTAPTVSISSPTTSTTFTTTSPSINLGGSAADSVGVTQVTWTNSRGGSGTASGTTAWTITGIALQTGSNLLTVTARDAAGNAREDTLTVTRNADTTAPVVTITGPTTSTTFTTTSPTVSLVGTASDANGIGAVTWTNSSGGSGTAAGTTSWTASSIPLQLGVNTLTVRTTDSSGNPGTDVLTVTRNADVTNPVVTITGPTNAATLVTQNTTLAVSGTASDAGGLAQITWSNNRGGSGTASGTTSWSVPSVALQAGANVITITATDLAGRTSNDVITVTRDNTAPLVTITGPTSNATYSTNSSSVTLSGTSSDTGGSGVSQVTWSSNRGRNGTASGTTNWSAAMALSSGSNVITVTSRDAVGLTSTDVITVTRN